jgi:DNA-binding MarR family transcriptional regulator
VDADPRGADAGAVARVAASVTELVEALWDRGRPAPVSPPQLRVLRVLERHEGINLRGLTAQLGSSPPSVSRLCDRLQAVGLIDRSPSSSSRRELRLRLNARGRSYLDDLRTRRSADLSAVISDMPAPDRRALLRGLTAFHAAAER